LNFLKALASLAIVLCIGYTLPLFLFGRKSLSLSRKWVLSLGLGCSILTEIYLLFFVFSLQIEYTVIYLVFFPSLLLLLYWRRDFTFASIFKRFFATIGKPVTANGSIKSRFIRYSAMLFGGMIFGILFFNLLARPTYQFDSRAIWMYKAKIIFEERTILSDAVLDQSRNHPHPQYPLLLPITASWIFANLDEFDDRSVRILFLLFFTGLMLATYELQRLESTVIASVLASLALLVIPFMYSGTRAGPSSGYADLLLSFYITSSTLAMALWLREKQYPYLLTGSLLAATGAMVKNEGLLFAANLLACTMIFSFRKNSQGEETSDSASSSFIKGNLQNIFLFSLSILIIGVVLSPWLYVRSKLPAFLDENYIDHVSLQAVVLGLERVPEIAKGLIFEFGNLRNWCVIWLLIGIAIVGWARKRGRIPSFVLAVMTVQLLAYAGIFMISPNDPIGHMRDALARLFFQVLPLGVTLIAYQLSPE
jgi:hypothetical protein